MASGGFTMKKKFLAVVCLSFIPLYFFSIARNVSSQEKEYFIGAPSIKGGAAAGKSISHWQNLFDKLKVRLEKELNVHLGLKIVPNTRVLFNELKKGNIHLAIFDPLGYIIAKKEGIPVKPYIALTPKGMTGGGICIYVHKDSGIKSVKELKGKKLGIWRAPSIPVKGANWLTKGSDPSGLEDWLFLRLALSKAGINQSIDSFFNPVTVVPSQESGLYVLLNKKFDAVVAKKYTWVSMEFENKQMNNLKTVVCDGGAGQPFVVHPSVDANSLKKFKSLFMNPALIPDIEKELKSQGLLKIFAFKDDTDANYNIYRQWLKQAESKGWLEEFRAFAQKSGGK